MYLIVNFIMKLPLVVEKDMILVVWNRLFKIAYFVAIGDVSRKSNKVVQR